MAIVEEFGERFANPHDSPRSDVGEFPGIGATLRYVAALVRRNLLLLASIIAGLLLAAVVATMLQTPRYTARSTVEINDRSQEVLGEQFDASSSQIDSWDVDRFLNTQVDILRSRALAERVARRLNLYSDARFFAAMQARAPEDFASEQERDYEVIELLMENLAVTLPPDSRIAELTFTTTDPGLSAEIANVFAAEFIQSSLQRRFESSSYARTFVAEQLEEARARLESSERELNAYARSAGLIRTRDAASEGETSSSVTAASLMQLNEAANRAQAERVAAEARWNAERAQPLLASPTVLASTAVQSLMSRRSDLEAQFKSAHQRYFDDHPAIARLESDLATVNAQIAATATDTRNSVRAAYLAARAAEDRLRQQVSELQGATLAEQERSVRYNTLAREADTNRSLYDGLLQRYRELNASAGITASNISIIDEAQPPLIPSSPNLLLNLAIALLLALLGGGGVLFLKEQLDDRVRVPEDVDTKVGMTLLGVIPRTEDEDPSGALSNPKSPVAEAYSALRGSLLYSTAEGLPRTLLVTSAQASEGKSTTSYAIARGFARAGKRILLVDADLRRPNIHRLVGASNEHGLSSLLIGEDNATQAVLKGPEDKLYILPSGPLPPSPAELLSSPRVTALLEELKQSFDAIIIDSAPVLGLADAPQLSALVDGVVMVIEADRARGGQLKAAVRRLRAMGPMLLGAVLTKFDPQKAGNQYSAYYGYDYYRYDAGAKEAA